MDTPAVCFAEIETSGQSLPLAMAVPLVIGLESGAGLDALCFSPQAVNKLLPGTTLFTPEEMTKLLHHAPPDQ
jgi:hypothetical protein